MRLQLLSMVQRDFQTRERLGADGSLFEGYHPDMQTVHEENASALEQLIEEHGWPAPAIVGEDGAEAAWLIAQHAIGLPDFQRKCLRFLRDAVGSGGIPPWQPAMLHDRICVFEGKLQIYGTSFDWDDQGKMSPRPIRDPERVDERRAAVGLPPLSEAIALQRTRSKAEPAPTDLDQRQRDMEAWAKRVGWR